MFSVPRNRRLLQSFLVGALGLVVVALVSSTLQAEDINPTEVLAVKWLPKPAPAENADAKTQAEMKAYTEAIPGTDLKFGMAPIPGGKFLMGSPASEKGHKDDEGPQVEVTVDPFWMGTHEVTWTEYETWSFKLDIQRRKMLNQQPTFWDKLADAIARPTNPYTDMSFEMGKEDRPAICMTQYGAQMYCKWLCAKTGRYYRLPTEAEWEYACRAGSKTAYSFGDDPSKLGDYAWYYDNSDEKYHKVGTKKPNAWGLYDMHGNVCEWVLDQYKPDTYKKWAESKEVKNPYVVATTEYPRIVRGGSWDDDAENLRAAVRRGSNKDWKMQDPQIPQSIWYLTDATFVGFRVVRPLQVPSEAQAKLYEPDPEILKEYRKAQGGKE